MKSIKKRIDVSRVATEQSLAILNTKIKLFYLEIYDHYYSEEQNLDDAILKNLINIMEYIRSIYSSYTVSFSIDSGFALEMLNMMKNNNLLFF